MQNRANIKHYITPKEEIAKYFFQEEIMNQSTLKTFLGGLEFKDNKRAKEKDELYYHENTNFILGDYLDGYLTQGEKFIEENYFSETLEVKPSDAVMSIVKYYFDNISKVSLHEKESETALVNCMRSFAYRNNYSDLKLLEVIRKEGGPYFTFLQKAQGKKIISDEEDKTIKALMRKLDSSVYKKQLFEAPWEYMNEDEDPECTYQVFFQKVLYFEHRGVRCKALLDILILKVNENTREVVKAHVIDLKTTGTPSLLFGEAVKKFRYDIQLAFYKLAVQISYDLKEEDIRCSFLVLGKVDLEEPMLRIDISDLLLYHAQWGKVVMLGNLTPDHTYLHQRYMYGEDAVFGFEWALRSYKHSLEFPTGPSETIKAYGTRYTLTEKGLI